jgi:acyl-coenzyme A thioesterase PaaI-like protein
MAALSGLEQLHQMLTGRTPRAPISRLTGMRLTDARSGTATFEMKINYLRPLAADGRYSVASGRVLHTGRRIAVASAEVLDADRKPIAIATGSAMLLPGRAASLLNSEP